LVWPLADALISAGYRIWYDEFQLKVGDSLRRSIDRGLVASRFGIVVLSPSFSLSNGRSMSSTALWAKRWMEAR
jgi:hypothetical protein